jgi:hypothetical protein
MLRKNDAGHVEVGVSAETKAILDQFKPMIQVIAVHGATEEEIQAAIDELNQLGTVQPIFDPTAFMRHSGATEAWMEFLRVFIKLRTAATELHAELRKIGPV